MKRLDLGIPFLFWENPGLSLALPHFANILTTSLLSILYGIFPKTVLTTARHLNSYLTLIDN